MRTTYISKDSDVVRQQGLKEKEVKALKQVWRDVGTFLKVWQRITCTAPLSGQDGR